MIHCFSIYDTLICMLLFSVFCFVCFTALYSLLFWMFHCFVCFIVLYVSMLCMFHCFEYIVCTTTTLYVYSYLYFLLRFRVQQRTHHPENILHLKCKKTLCTWQVAGNFSFFILNRVRLPLPYIKQDTLNLIYSKIL